MKKENPKQQAEKTLSDAFKEAGVDLKSTPVTMNTDQFSKFSGQLHKSLARLHGLDEAVKAAVRDWDGDLAKLPEALDKAKGDLASQLKAVLTDEVYNNLAGNTLSEKLESLKTELSRGRRLQSKADALAGKAKATPDDLQKAFDTGKGSDLEGHFKAAIGEEAYDKLSGKTAEEKVKSLNSKMDRSKPVLDEAAKIAGKKPEEVTAADLRAAVDKMKNDEKEKAEKKRKDLPWYQTNAGLGIAGFLAVVLVAMFFFGDTLRGWIPSPKQSGSTQNSAASSPASKPPRQPISDEEVERRAQAFVDHYIPKIERED